MWSQEQVAVDSHDERLVRLRQMVQEEVRGGQPQVTDRDVHGAIALFSNLARRVGAVPRGAPLPAAMVPQRQQLENQSSSMEGRHPVAIL